MRLISLHVKNHNKYKLNPKMREFIYTPVKEIQVLLGSNGSGKTSTYGLVFPYPEDPKVLEDEGFVTQEYKHLDKSFKLSMKNINNKVRYSFLEEGIELNESHLFTIQCELVKEKFGITKDIQNVLTDRTTVTGMSANEIKNWITRLSSTDYDYILGVYSIVRKKLTFVNNIIKHNNKKKALELDKERNSSEEKLTLDLRALKEKLDYFIDKKEVIAEPPEYKKPVIENLIAHKKVYEDLLRNASCENIGDVKEKLLVTDKDLSVYEDQIKSISSDINDMQIENSKESLDNIPSEEQLSYDKQTLIERIGKNPLISLQDAQMLNENIARIEFGLRGIMRALPSEEMLITRRDVEVKKEERETLKNRLIKVEFHLTKIGPRKAELDHLKEHDINECPKCSHKFYTTYDKGEHAKLIEDVSKAIAFRDKAMGDIASLEDFITEQSGYLDALEGIAEMRRGTKLLEGHLWNNIDRDLTDIESLPKVLDTAIEDIKRELDTAHAYDDLEKVEKYLAIHAKISKMHDTAFNDLLVKYETNLNIAMDNAKIHRLRKTILTEVIKASEVNSLNYEEVENSFKVVEQHVVLTRKKTMQTIINNEIAYYKSLIQEVETELSEIKLRNSIIRDIDDQLEVLQKELIAVKILSKELSPDTGLIGVSLKSFMESLVGNMNIYLQKIWTHGFELLAPKVVRGRMKYVFPVSVAGNEVPTIKDCSTGERNMINISFKLVLMQLLKLDSFPLILDEFGNGLDPEHKRIAYKFIAEELSLYGFSTLFLTSHFSELYTVFSDNVTDYVVLRRENTDLTNITPSDNLVTI